MEAPDSPHAQIAFNKTSNLFNSRAATILKLKQLFLILKLYRLIGFICVSLHFVCQRGSVLAPVIRLNWWYTYNSVPDRLHDEPRGTLLLLSLYKQLDSTNASVDIYWTVCMICDWICWWKIITPNRRLSESSSSSFDRKMTRRYIYANQL